MPCDGTPTSLLRSASSRRPSQLRSRRSPRSRPCSPLLRRVISGTSTRSTMAPKRLLCRLCRYDQNLSSRKNKTYMTCLTLCPDQVAKHPLSTPGPAGVYTPPPSRHATLPGAAQVRPNMGDMASVDDLIPGRLGWDHHDRLTAIQLPSKYDS